MGLDPTAVMWQAGVGPQLKRDRMKFQRFASDFPAGENFQYKQLSISSRVLVVLLPSVAETTKQSRAAQHSPVQSSPAASFLPRASVARILTFFGISRAEPFDGAAAAASGIPRRQLVSSSSSPPEPDVIDVDLLNGEGSSQSKRKRNQVPFRSSSCFFQCKERSGSLEESVAVFTGSAFVCDGRVAFRSSKEVECELRAFGLWHSRQRYFGKSTEGVAQ
ncbi:hypothetical protein ACLOJK_008573 [Asimina triloba]